MWVIEMNNQVVFAAAGHGKTYSLCSQAKTAIDNTNKHVLLISYTNEGVRSLENEYRKQNGGVLDDRVIFKSWYSTLLSEFIKPYQCSLKLKEKRYKQEFPVTLPENFVNSIAFYDTEAPPKWYNQTHVQYYVNKRGDVVPDRTSHLAWLCNEHSSGKVIRRIQEIYSHIFIDELQDYAGWDLEVITLLFKSNAKLLVIDPVQAYLGETDIASAAAMRKVLRQLAAWAAMYDCAVVLIGHLNKKQSSKDLYRGLGSIDLVAAARSVLHIERLPEDEDIAVIHHVKSSLTQKSKDVYFTLDANHRVEWLEQPFEVPPDKSTKQMIATSILKMRLANGPAKATDILEELKKEGIGERTIHQVKKQLEIRSVKRDTAWYWLLPESESGR